MRSVLDDLGEEVTGIVSPVSLCMALTVALVRILNPEGESNSNAVFLAAAYYTEQEGDSAGQKFSGALLNALIFVGVVAVMTFILVLLFKYGCVKWIYAYMGLAGFSIFFVLTGVLAIELLQHWDVHTDFISFTYILWNFAVVGSLTLFFFPAPLLMKQAYLVITGVVTAYVFTWLPEWTTWILLVAMALYDVIAVLVPGGPLKMLVELAQEREETIPALVYEARPVRRAAPNPASMRPEAAAQVEGRPVAAPPMQHMAAGRLQQELPLRSGAAQQQQQQQQLGPPAGIHRDSVASVGTGTGSVGGSSSSPEAEASPDTPLIRSPGGSQLPADLAAGPRPWSAVAHGAAGADVEAGAGGAQHGAAVGAADQPHRPAGQPQAEQDYEDDDAAFSLPDSIKLGLGDFIFYSVLVGRAAMYDFLTVIACYIAVIAGLGCTLLWLAMARKALPALPISIALAVSFYFISRFVMEPVVLPAVLQLVFF